MARTPKAPPRSFPARRGRKPKQAEPLQPAAPTNDDASDAQAPTPEAASFAPDSAPLRNKPGRKPKQRPEAAIPALPDKGEEQPGMDLDQPNTAAERLLSQGDEMTDKVNGDKGGFTNSSDAGLGKAAPTASQDDADQLRPAARWDKAADMVQFDWPVVEQTAAVDGPNQPMAKLLLAAGAEGANSRWSLA